MAGGSSRDRVAGQQDNRDALGIAHPGRDVAGPGVIGGQGILDLVGVLHPDVPSAERQLDLAGLVGSSLESAAKAIRGFARSRFAAGYHARAQSTDYPSEAYDQLVQQGLLGMTLPERLGGQGGDEMAFGIAMEELAWADFNLAEFILLPSIAALSFAGSHA